MKENGLDLPSYDLSITVEATENFSDENKLSQGGFGPVYKVLLKQNLIADLTASMNLELAHVRPWDDAGEAGGGTRDCCEEALRYVDRGSR